MTAESNDAYIGIDLGTTYSSISYYNPQINKSEIIKLENRKDSIPSWISIYNYLNGGAIVGQTAKNEINSDYVAFDVKRIIGRELHEIDENELKSLDGKLKEIDGKLMIDLFNQPKNQREYFFPEEISGFIIKYLLNELEKNNGKKNYKNVVVTVPAKFNEKQLEATERAALFAGIQNVVLKPEPIAAIHYYMKTQPTGKIPNHSKILVIDFGGGTLDLALCEIKGDDLVVKASGTNQNLGGNNFDSIMMQFIKNELIENMDEDKVNKYFCDDESILQEMDDNEIKKNHCHFVQLKKFAENVKIEMSESQHVNLKLDDLMKLMNDWKEYKFTEDDFIEIILDREKYETLSTSLIEEFETTIKNFLADARCPMKAINNVLLIGGTCQMPIIQNSVNYLFKDKIIKTTDFNPMTSVCQGAALYSYEVSQIFDEYGLIEPLKKSPFTIEFKLYGENYQQILIKDKTPLPFSKVFKATSKRPNEKSLSLTFHEYDNSNIESYPHKLLLDITHNNLKETNEKTQIKVHVKVDENLLSVESTVYGTNDTQKAEKRFNVNPVFEMIKDLQPHFNVFAPKRSN